MKRILILKAGAAIPGVAQVRGDYEQWFERGLGGPAQRFAVYTAFTDGAAAPPALTEYDAAVVSGSPASVCEWRPWMQRLADTILEGAEKGVPVLAVCFGHQLVAQALGGRVEPNPRGWEIGTVEVGLTEAGRSDPLFEGLPPTFAVQESHRDAVALPPPGAEVLASNEQTPVQALRYPKYPSLRTVQFHPELDPETMRATLKARGQQAQVRDEHQGTFILERFERNFGAR